MILNEPAAQKEAFNLASLLTNVNPYNLIKPKVANGCLLSIVMVNDLAKLSLNLSKPDIHALKKSLPLCANPVYGYSAPAKSGVGIGVPITCIVPTRTKRVFLSAKFLRTQIMVGWMRLPKGRPVSIQAGYANLVQLTTSLRLASLGGEFKIHCIEAAIMATTPTQKPQFIWIIAAVRRDCPTITAKIHHIAAESERDARRSLVRDHVCFFAGRIRMEVAHD
ncbi:host cell division inhibitor Icd-like protein [Escherichia coli]|uniref:host cell division inhibitor Icd-like protein n=1 Tax=Escherichia coli TaxID=562 RepID=UPI0020227446|nr:host cell division inhibitor Icd-like protein [Escherichia coli]